MDLQFLDNVEALAHRLGTSMSTLFKITAIVVIALILKRVDIDVPKRWARASTLSKN